MKYKELKSLLGARDRMINELNFKENELIHLLNQKVLIGDPEFNHKEEENHE